MKWWKRILFSICSLIFGFVSLDYLIYAYRIMSNSSISEREYRFTSDAPWQALGVLLFIGWFIVLAFYYQIIKRCSNKIDLIEKNEKKQKYYVKRKWTDIILQVAFLMTGIFIRWCYLMFIYFPKM